MFGGVLRFIDLATDLWYVYTQDFQSPWMSYLSLAFVFSPSFVLFAAFFVLGLVDLCRGAPRLCLRKCGLGLLIAVADPLGLLLCGFGCALTRKRAKKQDFYVAETLTRTAGFVEGLLESLPQLVLQSYNNMETDNWDAFTISSVALSAGGFLYSYIKLLHALDKVRHTEDLQKQTTLFQAGSISQQHVHPVASSESEDCPIYEFHPE